MKNTRVGHYSSVMMKMSNSICPKQKTVNGALIRIYKRYMLWEHLGDFKKIKVISFPQIIEMYGGVIAV